MTQVFTRAKPNLVNNPIDVSSDIHLSLPGTISLPSTLSLTQISQTPFPPNFPRNLDARYRENSTKNIHLRVDWVSFVASLLLFGHHHESNRLHNWRLKILQYRQDINKDTQEFNIQLLTQDNMIIQFEITVVLNNISHHSLSLAHPNITAQSLPSHL